MSNVIPSAPLNRHAELGSASIAPPQPEVGDEKWTLERKALRVNQVQGDEVVGEVSQ